MLPICASRITWISATCFQGTLEINFHTGFWRLLIFLITRALVCKNNRGTSLIDDVFFIRLLWYQIKKLLVSPNGVKTIFVKVTSFNTLLHKLLIPIRSSLKAVPKYNFNIGYLSSAHTIFSSGRVWRPVVIFRNKKGSANKKVWETLLKNIAVTVGYRNVHSQ